MQDIIHCRNCGAAYYAGSGEYCTKCGTHLPERLSPEDELRQMEKETKPYEALRFTSDLIIFFGWLWIAMGWLVSLFFYPAFVSLANFLDPNKSGTTGLFSPDNIAMVFVMVGIVSSTLSGIFVIASGQLFAVILNIRDDMNLTARLVRRFGLMLSEKN